MNNSTFHFIFGLSEDFAEKPFCYFHYLNIKSCYLTQGSPKIIIHYIYEPKNNIWWEKAKEFCEIEKHKKLPDLAYKCNDQKVWRIEHQADIFRLLLLKERGGVYADIDTLFYRSFFPTFENENFVMGQEGIYHINHDAYQITGLCNALIISKLKAIFLDIWLESYKSEYDNYDWNKMSVRVPYRLAKENPSLIHIEPTASFHKYNWNKLFYLKDPENLSFSSNMSDSEIYSKHMAESKVFEIIKKITPAYFKDNNSLYSKICKNIKGLL